MRPGAQRFDRRLDDGLRFQAFRKALPEIDGIGFHRKARHGLEDGGADRAENRADHVAVPLSSGVVAVPGKR